mgnify:CR=1 FL=1
MPVTITNDSKNSLTITNIEKTTTGTWADFDIPWEDADVPWSHPGTPITNDTKNSLTVTNETKN